MIPLIDLLGGSGSRKPRASGDDPADEEDAALADA